MFPEQLIKFLKDISDRVGKIESDISKLKEDVKALESKEGWLD